MFPPLFLQSSFALVHLFVEDCPQTGSYREKGKAEIFNSWSREGDSEGLDRRGLTLTVRSVEMERRATAAHRPRSARRATEAAIPCP